MKKIAMCWKCSESLFADSSNPHDVKFKVKIFKGCKLDARINHLNNNTLCPIISSK